MPGIGSLIREIAVEKTKPRVLSVKLVLFLHLFLLYLGNHGFKYLFSYTHLPLPLK